MAASDITFVDLTPPRESWPRLVQILRDALDAQTGTNEELRRFLADHDDLPYAVEQAIYREQDRIQNVINELKEQLTEPWARSVSKQEKR